MRESEGAFALAAESNCTCNGKWDRRSCRLKDQLRSPKTFAANTPAPSVTLISHTARCVNIHLSCARLPPTFKVCTLVGVIILLCPYLTRLRAPPDNQARISHHGPKRVDGPPSSRYRLRHNLFWVNQLSHPYLCKMLMSTKG